MASIKTLTARLEARLPAHIYATLETLRAAQGQHAY